MQMKGNPQYRLFFMVIALCFCTVAARAQGTRQVVFPLRAGTDGKEYIREWLILGPFSPDDLDTDFLQHVGGEANANPVEGETITTSDGGSLSWRRYESRTNAVNLLDALGDHKKVTAYAFCTLRSDTAGEARFYAGSDDGIAVWINGRIAHRHSISRALTLDKDMFRAELGAGDNRCLVKVSQGSEAWGFALRVDMSPPNSAVLWGNITDEKGHPAPEVAVYLEQNGEEVLQAQTDRSGNYRMEVYPASGSYDLYASKGESGDLKPGIPLYEGEQRRMNLRLTGAVRIEGTVLMLDNKTPHAAVVVQAVAANRPVAAALTDETGKYKLVNLRPGSYQVRCHVMGGCVYYREGRDFVSDMAGATPLRVRDGRTIRNINFRFAPLKKGTWRSYNSLNGLAFDAVNIVHRAFDGAMWFGTGGGGVSRYDGKTFTNFTIRDAAELFIVSAIDHDRDGVVWFGTWNGVVRYDGAGFASLTKENGLIDDRVRAVCCAPDGTVWFGTWEGASRYDGKSFTNFTVKDGLAHSIVLAIHRDPDGAMWFGTEGGVSRYDGKSFTNFTVKDGLAHNYVWAIYRDRGGVMWFGTAGGASRYDGKSFTRFTKKDGLAGNSVLSIDSDQNGVMWFGTEGSGVSRYDGKSFVNFTMKDGLLSNIIWSISCDPDGTVWFGTGEVTTSERGGVCHYDESGLTSVTAKDGFTDSYISYIYRAPDGAKWLSSEGSGIFRYDGMGFTNLTEKDGLVGNDVLELQPAADGAIWIGARPGGVSRYDGKKFRNFSTEDGLPAGWITAIYPDSDGSVWFGTFGGGASHYDGKKFQNFTTENGLGSNHVMDIHRAPDGVMWFGLSGYETLSQYDGKQFKTFELGDGLQANMVYDIYQDPEGVMWFGTWGSGILRYDGQQFTSFTAEDGLANAFVFVIDRDKNGNMWVGTDGGGLFCYDGTAWTSLDTRDGLTGNKVGSIYHDTDGTIWIGATGGVTKYRRGTVPPGVQITSVTADQTYRNLSAIPDFPVGTRVTIGYTAIDFKTLPEKRQYRSRIREVHQDWLKPTKSDSFDYTFDKPGDYSFEVQAIDRDLNYSEPASLSIAISHPPFYRTGVFLIALSIIGGGSLCGLIILWAHRLKAARAERLRLQRELEDAQQMQLGLLPEKAPDAEGFEIAGFSKPAREVGGDFFDYFSLVGGRTGIAIADVSGKGLKSAMNAVLANGMLHEVVKNGVSCGGILSALNADLYPRMEKQMFASLGLAVLERDARTLFCANAAQPHPMIRRGDRVFEIKNTAELPLGMMPDVAYRDLELDLQPGDVIIFYTDGVVEAENEAGEMYGTGKMEISVMHMDPTVSAEEIMQYILQDVFHFIGATEQYDDMTIVVVKKL